MKKKLITLIAIICGFAGVLGGVFATKDTIVIYMGIRAFRGILIGLMGLGGVTVGAFMIHSAVSISRLQDQLEDKRQEQLALEEIHRKQTARLSVQGKLDNETLRRLLAQKGQDSWGLLSSQIEKNITQLEMMDDYQDRLSKLLASNGADTLSDTEDVLDQAEQGMCRNVRKVINYMEVANSNLSQDRDMIAERLQTCETQNQEILKQTQEFVFALTEYLNRQGDSNADTSMLEIYKKTILDAIDGAGN